MRHSYIADRLFDGRTIRTEVPLTIEDGRILCLDTVEDVPQTRLEGLVAPGYLDIQVNGGGGVLFNGAPTLASLSRIFAAHVQYGTTAFLPTLITDDIAVMRQAADTVSEALAEKMPGLLGLHFEGPHISLPKKGVHAAHYIRELSEAELMLYAREDIGVRHMTVAPEMVSPAVIRLLTDMGVIVSLGHSNATFEEARAALEAGARGFTHMFNAMSPLEGRAPGMVGAALLSRDSWCSMIMDGHHVHYDAARLVLQCKPRGKMMLVTDAMPPVGTEEGEFDLLGETVHRVGDKLTVAGGRLAGSVLDMAAAVRNAMQHLDLPLTEAVRMASLYPAEFLKVEDEIGTISPGKKANFILLNESGNLLSTWVDGIQRY